MKYTIEEEVKGLPRFEEMKLYTVPSIRGERKRIEQENFKAIKRPDKKQASAVVSTDYTLVQHEEAFLKVLDQLPEDIVGKVKDYKTKAAMKIFPKDEDVGIWVMNSVDSRTAVRVRFIRKENGTSVHLPTDLSGIEVPEDVSGYTRLHRGEVVEEYEDFLKTISNVRKVWQTVISKLSDTQIDRNDLSEGGDIYEIAGKTATKKLKEWIHARRKSSYTESDWLPDLWTAVLQLIKIVSRRSFTSDINREERLRRLSTSLLSYALKA